MSKEIKGQQVVNDIVDEVYEIDDEDEIINEREIKNQMVDGEVNVSDDSGNYIKTPGEDEDNDHNYGSEMEDKHSGKETHSPSQRSEDTFRKTKLSGDFGKFDDELKNLNLDQETLNIFKFITAYDPVISEPAVKLKPFIPDYIPAIGEVDGFLKIPRPDGKEERLGSERIDEPALNMSKKSYLDLMIREFFKGKIKNDKKEIHTISNAHKNPKLVQGWINDVSEIHRQRIAPSVFYSKKMPDIDNLMQPWESEIESTLSKLDFRTSDLPISTEKLTQIVCNIAGVPIHKTNNDKNIIESLHVLFTLYSAFDANDHFQTTNNNSQKENRVGKMNFN